MSSAPLKTHHLVIAALYDAANKRCTPLCLQVAAESQEDAARLADATVRETFMRELGMFEPVCGADDDLLTGAELQQEHGYEYAIRVVDGPDFVV